MYKDVIECQLHTDLKSRSLDCEFSLNSSYDHILFYRIILKSKPYHIQESPRYILKASKVSITYAVYCIKPI